jgi:hypothetical protein
MQNSTAVPIFYFAVARQIRYQINFWHNNCLTSDQGIFPNHHKKRKDEREQ